MSSASSLSRSTLCRPKVFLKNSESVLSMRWLFPLSLFTKQYLLCVRNSH
jgi:hypothetical protein